MGVRKYDPILGRFISPDPLKGAPTDPQQRNRYTYVGNNPLVRYDLSGLSWWNPWSWDWHGGDDDVDRLPPYSDVNPHETSACGDWAESASVSLFPPSLPFAQGVEYWRWGESPQFAARTAKNATSIFPPAGLYFLWQDSNECIQEIRENPNYNGL